MNRSASYVTMLLTGGLFATAGFAAGWLSRLPHKQAIVDIRLGVPNLCEAYDGLPPGWPESVHAGMQYISAGKAKLGSERGYADERPVRSEPLAAFWIDATEVTNAQFAAFVAATGHVTDAERMGGGVVFVAPPPDSEVAPSAWWQLRPGADWRHPDGPDSTATVRASDPVVQITRADALAYARWMKRDLPSEAEWEFAAKAGRDNDTADADVFDAQGNPQANFWQGAFPFVDTAADHHAGRAPVGCYSANSYGLHDMIGNVWEWTRDDYSGADQPHGSGHAEHARATATPVSAVIKGGSYLCAENFCVRYRTSARHPQEIDLPTSHVGFRTVMR